MRTSTAFLLVLLSWFLFASLTTPLRSFETQVLLQLRKHLEYPMPLTIWGDNTGDFCSFSHPPQLIIQCQNGSVTELRIVGDKPSKVSHQFTGHAIPNQTLSKSFSIDSFVTTLTRLSSLRVVSLVSLGIWGQLPEKINRLQSLEALDMSSNFVFGLIPSTISKLVKLQSLKFDGNYFNDSVPHWLDSFTNLTILSLRNNRLKGPIPSAVSRITMLTEIVLSHNLLSGKLPDLSSLSNLQLLDLRNNKLDSRLPPLPNALANLFLSNNLFSGSIAEQFSRLNQLQHLDLSGNHLSGAPPALLFSLPNISYLNLSSNSLTGSFPDHFKCGEALSLVDLSSNRFTGELPKCLDAAAADERIIKSAGNCFSAGNSAQHSAAHCKDLAKVKPHSPWKETAVLVGVIVVVSLLTGGVLVFFRRRHARAAFVRCVAPKAKQGDQPSGISLDPLANARLISKMGKQSASSYREYSMDEIQEATKSFDQGTFLGEGCIGKVHKGELQNGTTVAIRALSLSRKWSIQNLRPRLDLLSRLQHPHLVALLGHCIDNGVQDDSITQRLFLVYEFVPNRDLHSHLSGNTAPAWPDRLALLIDIAKAVHFLHTGVIPPCFDNGLKTNNILLDDEGIGKLNDYGMSIISDGTENSKVKCDGEDDVYNFGCILRESLTSLSSQDSLVKIVLESLAMVVSITNKCVSAEVSNRPSFEEVLWNLQYAAQVQATTDVDQ